MRLIFAGPSLFGLDRPFPDELEIRGPARQGDVFAAVEGGATVIGLVDGFFEAVASVWHKEILYALSRGVHVLGSSSMGALRAAECADFGMKGVGEIFEAYRSGKLVDDDAVALVHGPAEMGYPPLTVPMVNVVWTVDMWIRRGVISHREGSAILDRAQAIHFKDRTWRDIVQGEPFGSDRSVQLVYLAKTDAIDQKRLDASALIDEVVAHTNTSKFQPDWEFHRTEQFDRLIASASKSQTL